MEHEVYDTMKSIKSGFIVSIAITAPMFLLTPAVVHLIDELTLYMTRNYIISLFIRSILLILYCALAIISYKKILLDKYTISDDEEKQTTIMISKYVIPSIIIGLFYATKANYVIILEKTFNIQLYIYSDFLSWLESNLEMSLSIVLLVVWWSYDIKRN